MSLQFNDNNFQEQVLNSEIPVLVDFWAPWCPPCRALGPTIDELAVEFNGVAKVGKLDVDESQLTAGSFGVSSIPAVLIFHNGKVVETLNGLQDKSAYVDALNKALDRVAM